MKTYAEFLRANGATDADVAVLDTPVARRAYDATQTELAAATTRAANEAAAREAYKVEVNEWHQNKIEPMFAEQERAATLAKANEARLLAAITSSQDAGLKEVAKQMGYKVDETTPPARTEPAAPALDAAKYFTKDEIAAIAEREGDAIALAQDISLEHARLFPDTPLNFRDLRRQAVAKKVPVEQLWMDTYHVADARAARAKAADDARLAAAREEGVKAERERLASQYGNPETRPLSPSTSPLAPRKDTGRDRQPWEVGEETLASSRVKRATQDEIAAGSKRAQVQ